MAINPPQKFFDPSLLKSPSLTTINSNAPIWNTTAASSINYDNMVIKGDLCTVQKIVPTDDPYFNNHDMIKHELFNMLLRELMSKHCIEFTKETNNITGNNIYRAHIYVTPDSQTREVRLAKKKGLL